MTTMNRRELIAAGPALAGLGFLTACAGQTSKQDLDRLAIVVSEIDVALRGMVPQLEQIQGMTPAVVARIVFLVDNAADFARQVAAAVDLNSAKPAAQQFVAYVNLVVAEVEKFSLPNRIRQILAAVQFALPIIVAIIQGA